LFWRFPAGQKQKPPPVAPAGVGKFSLLFLYPIRDGACVTTPTTTTRTTTGFAAMAASVRAWRVAFMRWSKGN